MRIHEICESIAGNHSDILTRKPSQHAYEQYREYRERLLPELLSLFEQGDSPPRWDVVRANKLKAVWTSSQRYGFVRNPAALHQIADLFFHNIARLQLNGMLIGHDDSGVSGRDVLEGYYSEFVGADLDEEYWTEERIEEFGHWASGARYSDHGMSALIRLAGLLKDCTTDEETLMVCDAILNVVHPSGDLSAWFVEGGQMTLSDIAAS